ncbi:hypothetical protein E1165_19430, partial [Micromonospora sp. KC723]
MSERTGLDDLLSFEEEPPTRPGRARGRPARAVLRALLVAAAATAVVLVGLRAVGLQLSVWIVVAGVLAVLAVRRVTGALAPPPPS